MVRNYGTNVGLQATTENIAAKGNCKSSELLKLLPKRSHTKMQPEYFWCALTFALVVALLYLAYFVFLLPERSVRRRKASWLRQGSNSAVVCACLCLAALTTFIFYFSSYAPTADALVDYDSSTGTDIQSDASSVALQHAGSDLDSQSSQYTNLSYE